MRSKKQLNPTPTFESVWAILQETAQLHREMKKENAREAKEMKKETKEMKKETKEMKKETKEMKKELQRMYTESRKDMKELNKQIGGNSSSNGEIAEAYFYNTLKKDKTFVNEKFDEIHRNRKYVNGEHDAEFDIILFNGKSAAIIEVKYNAKPDNISVRNLISRIEAFKLLYPKCKNHSIYLGVAAMTFRKGMEERLHRAGIATIRQIGKKMVVYDKEVKVF
jgi:predicted RNase H-like nuclease (RuvC/YqgF family)